MTEEPKSKPGYEIGWGKPPQHTRFKKGRSANPKGRPTGTRNLKTDLINELGGHIRVREGDREILISKQEAFLKSLIARALNGDARASALLINMMAKLLDVASAPAPTEVSSDEQEIIDAYYNRRFADAGIPKVDGTASENLPSISPQEAAETTMAAETGSETRGQPLSSNTDPEKA
jgi:hypothetical protein